MANIKSINNIYNDEAITEVITSLTYFHVIFVEYFMIFTAVS